MTITQEIEAMVQEFSSTQTKVVRIIKGLTVVLEEGRFTISGMRDSIGHEVKMFKRENVISFIWANQQ